MTSVTGSESRPGYYVEPGTGARCSLPWPGDPELPLNHPDRTALLPVSLGPGLVEWAERRLVHHLYGTAWRFTRGQVRFLYLWYAVEPADNDMGFRWLYRSGVKRAAKGAGKDPFGAAWLLMELCGPVIVVGWVDGRPVGGGYGLPLVQIAANSEAQAKDVLRVANAMASRAMREEFGLDCGETRTTRQGGGRLELLTASESSAEGDPASAIMLNESHHMTESNGGHRIAEVARRNVAKSPFGLARLVEFTNAHEEGAGSVAEQSYQAWQAQVSGRAALRDILYDTREAAPDVNVYDMASRRAGIAAAYSDSPWTLQERIEGDMLDPRTSLSQSLRFYMNVIAANEESWVEPRNWDAMAAPDVVVADQDRIALFLDCSKSEDSTSLQGCRISDGHSFSIKTWRRPRNAKDWLVPRDEVDAAVRDTFSRYRVMWFGVDPSPARDDETERSYWMGLVDAWHRDYGAKLLVPASPESSVLFDMRTSSPGGKNRNRAFCEAAEQTAQEVDETTDKHRAFTHDGDAILRLHVHNARRYPTDFGMSLGKVNRYSSKLVDAAVAMVGARLGRRLVLNSGKLPAKERTGRASFR